MIKKVKDLKRGDILTPIKLNNNGDVLPPKVVKKVIKSKLENDLVEVYWNYPYYSFGNDVKEIYKLNDSIEVHGNWLKNES